MSDNSKIEWTDATWNPLRAKNPATGKLGHHCVKISPACTHCYAASMNKRLGTGLDYVAPRRAEARGAQASTPQAEVFLDIEALRKPFHWKRPRRIFPCSMTDLLLDGYSDWWLDCVFSMMAATPWHTYQVLTKRPQRLFAYGEALQRVADEHALQTTSGTFTPTQVLNLRMLAGSPVPGGVLGRAFDAPWPLPNVQLGVTAENQECADERIPWLLKTPAAVRFVSCEPLLGEINLQRIKCHGAGYVDCLDGRGHDGSWAGGTFYKDDGADTFIAWVIVGGESGQQARPMHPDWARGLRDQCQAAHVPFFFKQWGEWVPWVGRTLNELPLQNLKRMLELMPDGTIHRQTVGHGGELMARLGKKQAGRLLDGREWNEFPQLEVAHA